jgi:hypothetical protein
MFEVHHEIDGMVAGLSQETESVQLCSQRDAAGLCLTSIPASWRTPQASWRAFGAKFLWECDTLQTPGTSDTPIYRLRQPAMACMQNHT